MIINRKITTDNKGNYTINTLAKRKSGKIQCYFIGFRVKKGQKKKVWMQYYENEIKKALNDPDMEQYETIIIRGNWFE
ncbi:hypothetical protein [Anaerocolumna aminovalerica]|jgi:hypothetical protein|uniref:hypothetical protein n=1 Tax=Anaerocolumna aminovalerica TaxID=1527 RepID=UPI00248CC3BC|nr:hypothetical protein [Anaerocolumna aminovalerica]